MDGVASGLDQHRVIAANLDSVCNGSVRYAPSKSLWFFGMLAGGLVGGASTFTWGAFDLFLVSTAVVLLFGHSLGSHRRLVHGSFQCPKWLEYVLVYLGVLVGLAGPIGLLRQHELRDYAQRLPVCHDYLRHGRSPWVDAWWQLNCQLLLLHPPGEWDPGWWVLLGLRRLGLVWAIRLPTDLPNRPELVTIGPSVPGKPFPNTKILTRSGIDGHGLVT